MPNRRLLKNRLAVRKRSLITRVGKGYILFWVPPSKKLIIKFILPSNENKKRNNQSIEIDWLSTKITFLTICKRL